MGNERVRLAFDKGDKILATHLEPVIDEAVQVRVVTEGQIAFEKDTVVAVENSYNRRSEALREAVIRRHGVLLLLGCRQATPIGKQNAVLLKGLRLRR
jgi:hypothetical protein